MPCIGERLDCIPYCWWATHACLFAIDKRDGNLSCHIVSRGVLLRVHARWTHGQSIQRLRGYALSPLGEHTSVRLLFYRMRCWSMGNEYKLLECMWKGHLCVRGRKEQWEHKHKGTQMPEWVMSDKPKWEFGGKSDKNRCLVTTDWTEMGQAPLKITFYPETPSSDRAHACGSISWTDVGQMHASFSAFLGFPQVTKEKHIASRIKKKATTWYKTQLCISAYRKQYCIIYIILCVEGRYEYSKMLFVNNKETELWG